MDESYFLDEQNWEPIGQDEWRLIDPEGGVTFNVDFRITKHGAKFEPHFYNVDLNPLPFEDSFEAARRAAFIRYQKQFE